MEDIINKINKNDFKSLASTLNSLNPVEFVTLGCIISIIMCECLNPNEQNTLGNFLEMIGQILITSYAQATTVDPRYIKASLCDLEKLKNQFFSLNKSKINTNNHGTKKE